MKKFWFQLVVILLVYAGFAFAQTTTANQGKPGNQGPWPVTIVENSTSDGGAVVVQSPYCSAAVTAHKLTVVGTSAANTPSAQTANRLYIELCNSLQNTGSPIIKCRADGVAPVAASGNAGDVLGIGDCRTYPVPAANVIQCISDAAGTNVTSYECVVIP